MATVGKEAVVWVGMREGLVGKRRVRGPGQ